MLSKALLYWHTIKYLKAKQIFFRIWKKIYKPRLEIINVSSLKIQNAVGWKKPIKAKQTIFGVGEFIFLGQSGTLKEIGWNGSEREKLWRYNQHYFSDLMAENADERVILHSNLIKSWIKNNPPSIGVGWEPYPCSLRIVNWIKWSLNGNELGNVEINSLANQASWLAKNLEWHILGNHLFANAKALIFAGLCVEHSQAKKWLDKGLNILKKEFPEQILSDGGHFELSPMYHIIVMEDVLDLINICRCFENELSNEQKTQVKTWELMIPTMQFWLETMCHPDSDISLFNDSAFEIAPHPEQIRRYVSRLNISTEITKDKINYLIKSGYIRLENKHVVLLTDVASVGPDYLPGHAHADTLSFEMSLNKKRIICNSGTSIYGKSSERLRQRSTAAHSTLEIDKKNSSEVWGGFRVARRAKVFGIKTKKTDAILYAEATHDGYNRLGKNLLHKRSWILKNKDLCIKDNVFGYGNHEVAIYYYFTPGWKPSIKEANKILVRNADNDQCQIKIICEKDIKISIDPTTYHPTFGTSIPNWRLRISFLGIVPLEIKTLIEWK